MPVMPLPVFTNANTECGSEKVSEEAKSKRVNEQIHGELYKLAK